MRRLRATGAPVMREMWDGSLIHRLDEIRIDASRPLATTVNEVVLQLRRFGFALLRGLARDNADAPQKLCSWAAPWVASWRSHLAVNCSRTSAPSDVEARDDRGRRSRGELARTLIHPLSSGCIVCGQRSRVGKPAL